MPTYLLRWEVWEGPKRRGIAYSHLVVVPSPDALDESNPSHGV